MPIRSARISTARKYKYLNHFPMPLLFSSSLNTQHGESRAKIWTPPVNIYVRTVLQVNFFKNKNWADQIFHRLIGLTTRNGLWSTCYINSHKQMEENGLFLIEKKKRRKRKKEETLPKGLEEQNKKLYEDWQPKENGRAPTKRFPLTSDPSMSWSIWTNDHPLSERKREGGAPNTTKPKPNRWVCFLSVSLVCVSIFLLFSCFVF